MSKLILIVDDNEDFLELMQRILSKNGDRVVIAPSGNDGLAAIAKSEAIDLVLLDSQIGDMSGTEFLDRLDRCNYVGAPTNIIYCSAGVAPEDARVRGSVSKMTDLTELVNQVRYYSTLSDAFSRREREASGSLFWTSTDINR
jgi:CheY-like chemotaxis protein